MFDIGGGELLLILLVVLLLFGPKKIPEVAQLIGKGVQKVRRAQEELVEQVRFINTAISEEVKPLAEETRTVQDTLARFPPAPQPEESISNFTTGNSSTSPSP
ncbi:MAG: twin-arginine translocase TatA/TatE family subunit [Bacteroidota bacterium]|nr:twin-arginine translocase TatA/TatE family subunit [Chlorobiota bacterium]MDW8074380.1 twin-arginine translocase TatA/TatE family subunit [Bacteroidota bacterium]MDW8271144.1 twin-arginine translocase TatA/TatE family subunit [Bacteroidota bacterium]